MMQTMPLWLHLLERMFTSTGTDKFGTLTQQQTQFLHEGFILEVSVPVSSLGANL